MKFVLVRYIERQLADGRAIILINIVITLILAWTASFWLSLGGSSLFALNKATFSPKRSSSGKIAKSTVDYSIISRKNIFNRSGKAVVESAPEPIKVVDPIVAPPTTLSLELLGTIITDKPAENIAVILKKSTKKQALYKIGSLVQPNAVITRVDRLTVFIDNNGHMEKLSINIEKGFPKSVKKSSRTQKSHASKLGSIREIGDGQVIMERSYLEREMKDMSKLLVQVRAVPYKNPKGQIEGFRLFQLVKGSIYQKIGLKNQDIVKRVNGQPINSAEQGLALLTALKNESNFTIDVVRNKSNKTLTVELQ